MIALQPWNQGPDGDDRLLDRWLKESAFGEVVRGGEEYGAWIEERPELVAWVSLHRFAPEAAMAQFVIRPDLIGTSAAVRVAHAATSQARREGVRVLMIFLHQNNDRCQAVAARVGFEPMPVTALMARLDEDKGHAD